MRANPLRARSLTLAALVATVPLGCPEDVEPHYDDDLGEEGVPVAPGAMAGTFALKMQITTVTELPALGESVGGGDTFVLVTRSYDEASATYAETLEVCGGRIAAENSTSTLPLESWQAIPATSPRTTTLRDADGYFERDAHLEQWGLDLDDPYDDPLPADEVEALEPAFAETIVDMDDDGNPGMTIAVEGLVSGNFYFVQRKLSDMRGIIRSEDEIIGLNDTRFEQTILGAESGVVRQGFPQNPHPDPKQSWVQEIRLADDAGCDDVLDAVETEALSRLRPF